MTNHTQRIKVIGFCDVLDKKHGTSDCTYFGEEHTFFADRVPSVDELRRFASALGCHPSRKRGSHPAKCDPIYFIVDAGASHASDSGLTQETSRRSIS